MSSINSKNNFLDFKIQLHSSIEVKIDMVYLFGINLVFKNLVILFENIRECFAYNLQQCMISKT